MIMCSGEARVGADNEKGLRHLVFFSYEKQALARNTFSNTASCISRARSRYLTSKKKYKYPGRSERTRETRVIQVRMPISHYADQPVIIQSSRRHSRVSQPRARLAIFFLLSLSLSHSLSALFCTTLRKLAYRCTLSRTSASYSVCAVGSALNVLAF